MTISAWLQVPSVLEQPEVATISAWLQVPSVLEQPEVAPPDMDATLGVVTRFGTPSAVAVIPVNTSHPATSLESAATFGVPVATTVCRVTSGIQLIPFIPSLIAYQDPTLITVVAQQEQPIPAPVFGTPSVSFATSHPAASLEANLAFGVPVVRAVHEAASLEPVVFGSGDMPTFSAQASSLFGQTVFGVPVVRTVHTSGDWYAGIRMGALAAVTTGGFPVLNSIESTEFGAPYLGATTHRAMPLYAMPQFGSITISRGVMTC